MWKFSFHLSPPQTIFLPLNPETAAGEYRGGAAQWLRRAQRLHPQRSRLPSLLRPTFLFIRPNKVKPRLKVKCRGINLFFSTCTNYLAGVQRGFVFFWLRLLRDAELEKVFSSGLHASNEQTRTKFKFQQQTAAAPAGASIAWKNTWEELQLLFIQTEAPPTPGNNNLQSINSYQRFIH